MSDEYTIIKHDDGSYTKIRMSAEVEHQPPTSGSKGLDWLILWFMGVISLVILFAIFIKVTETNQSSVNQNNPVIINNN